MKVFKVLVLALAAICLLAPLAPSPVLALADGPRYAVADTRNVWFYAGRDESARLFLLPYTYYVRVLSEEEEFVPVEYLTDEPPYRKITGFCKKSELKFVDFIPERPYLYREITASYALPQGGTLGDGAFTSIERTFVYYGHRYEGAKLYFYVGSEGVFDYIPAQKELEYELNTDYLEAERESISENSEGSSLSVVAIVMICLGVAVCIAVAVFVLKGKKHEAETERAEF